MTKPNQAGVTTLQIILALTLIAVAIGVVATLSSSADMDAQPAGTTTEETRSGESPLETFAQNQAESITEPVTAAVAEQNEQIEAAMTDEVVDMNTPGSFTDYDANSLALAENGTVVLFFHASWCPSCRGLEDDINANLSAIPDNTHIVKVDYDEATELKRTYSVTRQHTMVVVDQNGTELRKLTGLSSTLNQLVSQI